MPYVEETRAQAEGGVEHTATGTWSSDDSSSSHESRTVDHVALPEWGVVEELLASPSPLLPCSCARHGRHARRQLRLARLREAGLDDSLVLVLEAPWRYYQHLPRPEGEDLDDGTVSSRGTQHDPVAEDTQLLPDVTQDTNHYAHYT